MATMIGETVYTAANGREYPAKIFSIKIAGKEREVLAWDATFEVGNEGDRYWTVENVALMRIGRGAKLHPTTVTIWRQKDGSYKESMAATRLNRAGAIVAWNEERYEGSLSRHNGESTYKAAV